MHQPIMTAERRAEAQREWARFWPIPIVSALGLAVSTTHLYSFGVLMPAISRDTGWGRSEIALGITITSIIVVIFSPFVGAAIDRYGSRRIALAGLIFYCAAVASLATAGASVLTWWLLAVVVAFGSLGIKATTWSVQVSRNFRVSRGLGLAVALCGTGIGSSSLPIISTLLVEQFGWRGAYVGLALIAAAITILPVWLFFRDASAAPVDPQTAPASAPKLSGLGLREAFLSTRFLRLALACFLVIAATVSLIVSFVPLLLEGGVTARTAAAIAGAIGISTIVGRLTSGYLLDRYNGPLIGLVSFSLPILFCVILLFDRSPTTALAAAIVLGLAAGAEYDIAAYMASRYFGLRHYGAIYGTMVGLMGLGAGIAPLLSSVIFDQTGGYRLLLLGLIPAFIAAAIMVATMGAYPRFDEAPERG